jgi:hypothetical protein
MIPHRGIGGEKSTLAQARLQEVCCFSAPFARRLHPSPSLSVPIRAIRGSSSSGFPDRQDQLAGHNPETLPFRDLYPEEVWIFVFS